MLTGHSESLYFQQTLFNFFKLTLHSFQTVGCSIGFLILVVFYGFVEPSSVSTTILCCKTKPNGRQFSKKWKGRVWFCTPPLQPIAARRSLITAPLALCGGKGQYLAVITVEISILHVLLYDSAVIAVTLTQLVLL